MERVLERFLALFFPFSFSLTFDISRLKFCVKLPSKQWDIYLNFSDTYTMAIQAVVLCFMTYQLYMGGRANLLCLRYQILLFTFFFFYLFYSLKMLCHRNKTLASNKPQFRLCFIGYCLGNLNCLGLPPVAKEYKMP